jgi:ATP-binding cassette subfamily B protein
MKTIIKAYKYGFKFDPFLMIMSLINTLSTAVLPFVALYYGGIILNMLVAKESFDSIMNQAWMLIILTFGLTVINYVSLRAVSVGDIIIDNKLKEALTEKNLRLDFATMEKQETKTMLTRAEEGSNGEGNLASFLNNTMPAIIKSSIMLVFSCFFLSSGFSSVSAASKGALFDFLNSPWSFLVLIGEIFLMLIASFFLMKYINKLSYDFYMDNTKANRDFAYIDMVVNDYKFAKDFRIFQMRKMIEVICNREKDEMIGNYQRFTKKAAWVSIGASLTFDLLLFSSYLYIGAKAFYGIIPIGSIITVVGSITNFANSLESGLSGISEASVQTKYLGNYFSYLELDEGNKAGTHIPDGSGLIEFKHVYFKYPNTDKYALEDVSFTIDSKKRLAIVGRNGAGKSTIIKLIARFYLPEKGEIDYDGININQFDFYEYQSKLGILFQDFSLFAFPLEENVASLPASDLDEAKVSRALDLVGYDYQDTKKLPKGLKTYLYKNIEEGTELSGGEAQKVGIARALYKDSPVILLDEPTSALDPLSEQTVYNSIDKLVNDRTSVFISHRMSSTKFCDWIVVLDQGKIIQEGTHKDLMKQPEGMYAKMFNEQAKYYR